MSTGYSKDYEYKDPTENWGRPVGDWFASKFDPDTLVAWPCSHGIKLEEHERGLNIQGNPLPTMGGFSWGRPHHLVITFYGAKEGRAAAIVKCIQCIAESQYLPFEAPADFPR